MRRDEEGYAVKACVICGKSFVPCKRNYKKATCCSKECKRINGIQSVKRCYHAKKLALKQSQINQEPAKQSDYSPYFAHSLLSLN
jgi:hypothetical protein